LFVSVCPYIPIPFSNPHFPNPILFPPKNIETEVEIWFFRPFPSVFIAIRDACFLPSPAMLVVRPTDTDSPPPPRLVLGIAHHARTSGTIHGHTHHPLVVTTAKVCVSRLD
jgi:hypothetical protein